jgi:uncharacterized RDD family membrane protein YckC
MTDISILTSQNVRVKYSVAGVGTRMLAFLIDLLLFAVWWVLILIILSASGLQQTFVVLILLIPTLYPLLMEVFFNGQSLGKMALDIRVVKTDGTKPGFTSYLLRWIFSLVDIAISFGSIATICIAFSKNSQRLGDMAAGTTVIRMKVKTPLARIVPVQVKHDYVPVFTEVNLLTEYDISLVRKVIHKRTVTVDAELSGKMARYLKNKMGITSDLDNVQFLKTVMSDYEYYALLEKGAQ